MKSIKTVISILISGVCCLGWALSVAGCAGNQALAEKKNFTPPPPAQTTAETPAQPAEAPPPPRVEIVGDPPAKGEVWIPGAWRWSGKWIWAGGYWALAPHPNDTWVPGYWAQSGATWTWTRGHWH